MNFVVFFGGSFFTVRHICYVLSVSEHLVYQPSGLIENRTESSILLCSAFPYFFIQCFVLAFLVHVVSYVPFQLITVINLRLLKDSFSRVVLHLLYITYIFCS